MAGITSDRIFSSALLLLGYAAILGLIDNFVRTIAQDGGLWQFHALRAAMVFAILAVLARPMGLHLLPRRWGPWLVRSLLHGSAMLIYFGCLAFLSVPQVAAGLFTAPIFVLIFSRFIFGYALGFVRVMATALGFAGVVLELQPGFGAPLDIASLLPLFAGALYGMASIVTREWCADESAEVLMAGMFVVLGVAGLIGMAVLGIADTQAPAGAEGFISRGWVTPSRAFLGWTLVQAVGSMLAVALMVRAYQLAEASRIAAFEYALLPISAFWAFLLWGEQVEPVALLGMVLIFVAGLLLSKSNTA